MCTRLRKSWYSMSSSSTNRNIPFLQVPIICVQASILVPKVMSCFPPKKSRTTELIHIYLPPYRLSTVYYFHFRSLKISCFQPPEMFLKLFHLILCISFFRIAIVDLVMGNPVRQFFRSKPLKKFCELLLSFSQKLFLKLIFCNTTPCFLV